MWDQYLRLDVLSFAFTYRGQSDKNYKFGEFGIKDCLQTSSLAWKLMMSLGQGEPIYTYSNQCTRHFIRKGLLRRKSWSK